MHPLNPHGLIRDDVQVLWGWYVVDTGIGARDIDVAMSEALLRAMATLAVKNARFLKRRLAQRQLWFQGEVISIRFANL